jgi:LPXTG-site transpeptidase (sortase) family protein
MTTKVEVAALSWIERGLLAAGVSLALWSGLTLLEARYFAALPIPPARVTVLPGEDYSTEDLRPIGTADARPLKAGAWVARLEAPSVGLAATVLEGTTDQTLKLGAGHIEDTAFPGASGNVGIAGHRDTTFRPVRNLKLGDPLVLLTADHVYEYRISATKIVNPTDVYVLVPTERPTLTLVTCYPFTFIGNAPQRYIVHAELVSDRAR